MSSLRPWFCAVASLCLAGACGTGTIVQAEAPADDAAAARDSSGHDLDARPGSPDAAPVADAHAAPDSIVPADAAAPAPDAGPSADAGQPPGQTIELQLTHGAFAPPSPTLPNAIVYIPTGFTTALPLDIVVYLHGWDNCIENVIRPENGTCTSGGAVHNAYNLANQLEASGKNAILLVPELAFEEDSSAIGNLADTGSFLALVDEVLGDVAGEVGGQGAAQVDKLLIASHSGAYTAAGAIVAHGGMTVDEVWLLDSLYGNISDFETWIENDEDAFRAPFARRFTSVYTLGGGTLANSQSMATVASGWFGGDATVILDDRTTDTLTAAEYDHGVIFKRTALAHDDVPRYYFQTFLVSSVLPDR